MCYVSYVCFNLNMLPLDVSWIVFNTAGVQRKQHYILFTYTHYIFVYMHLQMQIYALQISTNYTNMIYFKLGTQQHGAGLTVCHIEKNKQDLR